MRACPPTTQMDADEEFHFPYLRKSPCSAGKSIRGHLWPPCWGPFLRAVQPSPAKFGKGFQLRRGGFREAHIKCKPQSMDGLEVARKGKKSEKSEKTVFAIFQLEPVFDQSVPNNIREGHFSDFSKNFRGYTGGRGAMLKAEGCCKKSGFGLFRPVSTYFDQKNNISIMNQSPLDLFIASVLFASFSAKTCGPGFIRVLQSAVAPWQRRVRCQPATSGATTGRLQSASTPSMLMRDTDWPNSNEFRRY
jgi:hypothetical protein